MQEWQPPRKICFDFVRDEKAVTPFKKGSPFRKDAMKMRVGRTLDVIKEIQPIREYKVAGNIGLMIKFSYLGQELRGWWEEKVSSWQWYEKEYPEKLWWWPWILRSLFLRGNQS